MPNVSKERDQSESVLPCGCSRIGTDGWEVSEVQSKKWAEMLVRLFIIFHLKKM